MDTVKDKLVRILQELLNPGSEIEDDATLEDLGAGSLDLVEIRLAIEEDFGCEISEEDMTGNVETKTVAEIAEWLEGKGLK